MRFNYTKQRLFLNQFSKRKSRFNSMNFKLLFVLSLIAIGIVMAAARQDAQEAKLRNHFMRIKAIVLGKFKIHLFMTETAC